MNEENQNAVVLNAEPELDIQFLGGESKNIPRPPEPTGPREVPDTGPLRSSTYVWDPVRDNADPELSTPAERQAMGLEPRPQQQTQMDMTPQQMMEMMMRFMQQAQPQQIVVDPARAQQMSKQMQWPQEQPPIVLAPQGVQENIWGQNVQPIQQAYTPTYTEPPQQPVSTVPQWEQGAQQVRQVPYPAPSQTGGRMKVFSICLKSQNPEGDGVKINGLMVLTDLLRIMFPGSVSTARNAMLMQIVMPDYEGDVQAARQAIARYDVIGTLGEEQAMRRAQMIAQLMPPEAMGAAVVRQFLESWYLGYLEAVV